MPEVATAVAPAADAGAASSDIHSGDPGPAQSDDQILGITADDSTQTPVEPQEPTQADPAAQADATQADASTVPAPPQQQQPVNYAEVLKGTLANQEHRAALESMGVLPAIKSLTDQNLAYRELYPTVAEAREVRSYFPTLEDARAASEAQTAWNDQSMRMNSGDPTQYADVVKGYVAENPQAAEAFFLSIADIAREQMPQAFQQMQSRALEMGMRDWIDQAAKDPKYAEFGEAAKLIYQTIWGDPGQSRQREQSPEVRALQEKNERLQAQLSKDVETRRTAFVDGHKQEIYGKIRSLVATDLKPMFEQAKMNEWEQGQVLNNVLTEIIGSVANNSGLQSRINQRLLAANGAYGPELGQKIEQLIMPLVSQVKQDAITKAIDARRQLITKTVTERDKKQAAAESRKDIAGGAATTGSSRPNKPWTKNDVKGLSEDDILNLPSRPRAR